VVADIIAIGIPTVGNFRQAGAPRLKALLASFGFGLVNFLFARPAVFTTDTSGRRTLLLFTFS
jgi:hypothetical protein